MKQMRPSICVAFFLAVATGLWCQQPDPPGQVRTSKAVNEAYLFAHMVQGDYGRLYYTVSLDGLHCKTGNSGFVVGR